MTVKIDETLNIGQCPKCNEHTHFNPTKNKKLFTCTLCLELVEQKINGRVVYTEVDVPGVIVDSDY
tara:strand:+ start:54 stop:251 length:198 start_codon:yes stop_codon:yes gene_type:complete